MSAWRAVTVVLTLMGLSAMQLWRLSTAAGFPPDIANRHYEFLHEGDVNLGAVVSVHKSVRGRCIEATTTGLSAIEFLEAIVFAMRQVNKEQVIPGVTLGVYILDDCFSASLSLMRALQFMPASGTNHAHHPSRVHPQDHTHLPSHVHSEGHTNSSRRGHISEDVQSQDEARSLDHTHHPGLVNVPDHIHVPQDAQFRDNGSLDDAQPSDQTQSQDHANLANLDSFHSSDHAHVIDHAHPPDNVHSSDHARVIHHAHPPENVLSPDHGHAKDHARPQRSDFRHYNPSASLLTLPLQSGGSLVSSSKTFTGKPAGSVSPGGTASEHASPVTAATASTKDAGFRFPLVNNFEEDGSDGSTRNKSSSSYRSYTSNSIANKVARNDAMHSDASKLLKTNVSGEVTTPFHSDLVSSDAVKPCKTDVTGGIPTPCRTDVVSSDVTTPSKPRPVSQSTSWAETSDTLRFFEVAGVIGAFTSQHSIEVAKVLQLFQLPLISPLATSDVLSDKQRFPYFLRTLPPNRDQVKAMGQLVRHFNWTYVSVVYSEDPYGHGSHGLLATTLAALDVCVAQTLTLPASMTSAHYDAVIRSLRRQARARVVLLYVDIKHVLPLLKAVERNGAEQELLWVGSDSLSNALWHNPHLCDPNLGSIAVHAHAITPPAFVAHMTSRIRDRSRSVSRVDSLLDWTMPADLIRLTAAAKEPSSSSSSSSLPLSLAAFVIDSVYAYAHALRALLSEHCPEARGRGARACVRRHPLQPYLRRVRFNGTSGPFEFDEQGDVVGAIEVRQCQQRPGGGVSSISIGMWEHRHDRLHVQRARFPRQEAGRAPSSVCAEPCGKGQIYAFTRQTCCWSCVACKANEVTTANASGCLPCAPFQWPDERSRRRCEAIKVPPTPTHPAMTLVLQVAAVIGLMMTTVTAVTFCLYRGQRVIRSSSRELSGVMLGGLVSSYLLVFPLLATPTAASCCLTHVGFGLTFTLVYAPLLVKTHRIFRIFRSGRQSAALPPCTSSASQLGITSALISVQVVIVTVSTAVDPPSAQLHQPVMTQPRVERLCHLPLGGMGTSLAYHVLLVLVCTVLAFKTRRLPDNYSESRYIAFCVDTTLLVWLTFVPAYFTASVGAHKVVVLSLTHLINSYVQLACLFLPRLHALYRQTKQLPDRGAEAGSQLGSYRLINLKGVGLGAGLGSGCASNSVNQDGNIKNN